MNLQLARWLRERCISPRHLARGGRDNSGDGGETKGTGAGGGGWIFWLLHGQSGVRPPYRLADPPSAESTAGRTPVAPNPAARSLNPGLGLCPARGAPGGLPGEGSARTPRPGPGERRTWGHGPAPSPWRRAGGGGPPRRRGGREESREGGRQGGRQGGREGAASLARGRPASAWPRHRPAPAPELGSGRLQISAQRGCGTQGAGVVRTAWEASAGERFRPR